MLFLSLTRDHPYPFLFQYSGQNAGSHFSSVWIPRKLVMPVLLEMVACAEQLRPAEQDKPERGQPLFPDGYNTFTASAWIPWAIQLPLAVPPHVFASPFIHLLLWWFLSPSGIVLHSLCYPPETPPASPSRGEDCSCVWSFPGHHLPKHPCFLGSCGTDLLWAKMVKGEHKDAATPSPFWTCIQ
ncbi:hypothetical protein H1C71_023586 [Ictidomys tridecemlineatus]|nr:hypothetical protein H1C71_023586 [Ictidomys tridecemlineatus]